MPTIVISTFEGCTPRTHPRLLRPTQAQFMTNAKNERGTLEPLRSLGAVSAPLPGAKTLFRTDAGGWLGWGGEYDIVRSAIVDSGGHFFMTGDGYPKQTTQALGGTMRRLGIPRPKGALAVELIGEPGETISRSSSYCYTYVMDMGSGGVQESAPSPPTGVFEVAEGQAVRLTNFKVPDDPGIVVHKYRVYRTVAGFSSGAFLFVGETGSIASSFTDEKVDYSVSTETLATANWDPPNSDAKGMILGPHGIYAMHRKNEVLLSEPFVPYAYPEEYRHRLQDSIVGLGFLDSAIVVLTEARPVILSGSVPEAMAEQPLPFDQGCVSKRSVITTPVGVMYASLDGLCLISAAGPSVLTREVFTPEQWRALNPRKMVCAFYKGQAFCFVDGSKEAVVYDVVAGDVRYVSFHREVVGAYHDQRNDELFVTFGDGPGSFEGGPSVMMAKWRSGDFFTSAQVLPAVVRATGEHDWRLPLILRLYAHGKLRHTMEVTSQEPVRLSLKGRSENCWTVELEGTTPVYEVRISTSIEELEHGV